MSRFIALKQSQGKLSIRILDSLLVNVNVSPEISDPAEYLWDSLPGLLTRTQGDVIVALDLNLKRAVFIR